ncbi:MAG: hypothetical protein PVF49_09165 [Anaerolineales bacterium]|jgi:hypothetical protein
MYDILLALHNITRWLVLVAAIWALARAFMGWRNKSAWTESDRKAGLFYGIFIDIQFLLGLILSFVSPIVTGAFEDLGQAMQVTGLRIILAEHIPLMVLALIVVHITSSRIKQAEDDAAKHRRALIGYGLATLLILIAIPWARRLFPGL